MVTSTWKTDLTAGPPGTYVLVERVPPSADEKTVREFFTFCGTIDTLELQKQESGAQSALIKFESTEAAKTALLLSHALINQEPIEVSPLYPETHEPATPPPGARGAADVPPQVPRATTAADTNYEGKPALYVAHELLAAGYMLGERVLSRASKFDAKYRATDRTQSQARSLDNQYKLSGYLQQWDDKFKVSNRAKSAFDKVQGHPVGQKVLFTVNEAYQSALQLSKDARDIAERKRANDERIFGKIPLPRAPSTEGQAAPAPAATSAAQPPAYTAPAGPAAGPVDYASAAAPQSAEKKN
ncbi:Protein vip1 [Coemansia biformis]|uniref:Protein vip1 n=1 Tax=Coemansia biformis TaxID=1286918 RepID=A0A9W8CW09_9FUNG|nr:Protein vip1 [Coemansia biformis]